MTILPDILSSRLKLVAISRRLAKLQIEDRTAFFEALGVVEDPAWPPALMDDKAMEWMRDELLAKPEHAGWYSWIYISPVLNRLMGIGGFKGAPDAKGEVEIGYSMLTSFREQGLATEGVMALINWAYSHDDVKLVTAKTRSDRNASHRVLEKAGFVEGARFYDEDEGFEVISWTHQKKKIAA